MHANIFACFLVILVTLIFVLVVLGTQSPDWGVEWQR